MVTLSGRPIDGEMVLWWFFDNPMMQVFATGYRVSIFMDWQGCVCNKATSVLDRYTWLQVRHRMIADAFKGASVWKRYAVSSRGRILESALARQGRGCCAAFEDHWKVNPRHKGSWNGCIVRWFNSLHCTGGTFKAIVTYVERMSWVRGSCIVPFGIAGAARWFHHSPVYFAHFFCEEPETRSVLDERNDGSKSTSKQSYANGAHALWS